MTTINGHTTRAAGTILTATIYNTDHVNHVLNAQNLNAGKIEKAASPVVDGDLIAFLGTGGAQAKTSGVNMSRLAQLAVGRTLIDSGNFPAAATATILNIPQTFSMLHMTISGASNANAANTLRIRGSDDNGASFAVGTYGGLQFTAGAAIAAFSTGMSDLGANTLAADTHIQTAAILNYQQNSRQLVLAHGTVAGTVRASTCRVSGIGAINAIEFGWTGAGNFDAGSFQLFGIS